MDTRYPDLRADPATDYRAITPADVDFDGFVPKGFYVETGGTLVLTGLPDDATAVTVTVEDKSFWPGSARRIAAASTASGITALI